MFDKKKIHILQSCSIIKTIIIRKTNNITFCYFNPNIPISTQPLYDAPIMNYI